MQLEHVALQEDHFALLWDSPPAAQLAQHVSPARFRVGERLEDLNLSLDVGELPPDGAHIGRREGLRIPATIPW